MNILVTGGTGFLGSSVCNKLTNLEHNVTAFDNGFTGDQTAPNLKGTTIYEGDINDTKSIDRLISNSDFVFHFAGILGTNETLDIIRVTNQININGTVNVLQACTKHNVPMICASKPNPINFLNPYSITKIAVESYCMMFHKLYKTRVTIPKIMYLYGPGQRPYPLVNYKKYIPTLVLAALRNEPIEIYGTGNQIIDPLYINDAAISMIDIMDCMIESPKLDGKMYDIGYGIGISINEIVKVIKHVTKSKSQILHVPMRLGEPDISTVLANTENYPLKMPPMTTFYNGLLYSIEYFKQQGE